MSFAVMDDSIVKSNGIYVYTHCLINYEETPQVLVLSGNNLSIYNEGVIRDFILENFTSKELYACPHYSKFPSIWDDLVDFSANDKIPRAIKRKFDLAHNTAKNSAKMELEKLLN